MHYAVNEVFSTVQGEATWTGRPSFFVRMQGCPVGCGWCDTKHTWELNPKNKISIAQMRDKQEDADTYAMMTTNELADECIAALPRHIVITGGEPALYDLFPITSEIIRSGKTVQVETSGTHSFNRHPDTWVTVSPKINMAGGFDIQEDALSAANEIKMPVGKQRDIDNLLKLINVQSSKFKKEPPPPEKVWLQPLSQNKKATALCVKVATERGWNVSAQVHKYLDLR